MRMQRMPLCVSAVALGAVVLTAALGCLTACAPTPVPTATPTAAFASEEEAYAAAEEVYRAYNDAVNARSNGTGGADADPQQYLTGLALEGDIDTQNLLASGDLHVSGDAAILKFAGETADLDGDTPTMTGIVCIDVSDVSLIDRSGADVTPLGREDKIAQRVVFLGAEDSLRISNESAVDGPTC
ncbi:hypothetical protein ASF80_14270 [Microbacterium sp. Leaf159]|nr:hypothetical protein ASF80_14270 [Microbacterium sp. Leaf159]